MLIDQIQRLLGDTLPEYMIPAAFVVLDALPLTPNGKIDRNALPEPDAAGSEHHRRVSVPRDRLELELAQLWEELLNTRPIDISDSFFSRGGHSLLAVRLVGRVEQQFGRKIPLTALFQSPTVRHMAHLLRQQDLTMPWSPLVGIQSAGTRLPFFCVHPVGGGALCYVRLAEYLGPDQPFYGLQSPSLETQQTPATSVQEMATSYIEAIRTIQPDGPYLLGGWSIGGVIAFEMAQQLHRDGDQVRFLGLIDTIAPDPGAAYLPLDEVTELMLVATELWRLQGESLPIQPESLTQPTLDQRLAFILDRAQESDILPADVGLEHMRQLLSVYRANMRAVQQYTPQIGPHNITIFQAADRLATENEATTAGWNAWSTGTVELVTMPGDHYGIVAEPYVQDLAEALGMRLAQAQEDPAAGLIERVVHQ